MMRHPLAERFVAGVRGVDIAGWRDERVRKGTPATVKRDLVLLGHVFEVPRKEWGIFVHNPVRDNNLPPGGRPRDRRLQPGEEARLFTACQEERNRWLLPFPGREWKCRLMSCSSGLFTRSSLRVCRPGSSHRW